MPDEIRRSAFALAAGLAVVVLVAVVAFLASGPPQDAQVAVSLTPSPAAVLDDRFGFLVSDAIVGPRPAIRRESDPRAVLIIGEASGSSVARPGAISPDGRRLAYWTGEELHVLDVAPDARPRTLLTLTTGQVGNNERADRVVWSSDGRGLVIGVQADASSPAADAPPEYSALRLLDAAGGQPREIVRLRGTTLIPLAWDRQARLVAAYESASGGVSAYDLIEEGGKLDRSPVAPEVFDLEASHDAQQVLASGFPDNVLRVWPLASIARAIELRSAGGERVLAASWRPGRAEIGVLFDDRLELWEASGARRPVPLPPLPPTSTGGRSLVFRADGSAVFHCRVLDRIVATPAGDRPEVYCVAVELASGRSGVLPPGGFFPGASVRIGP